MAKSLGVPFLPSRLVYFIVASICYAICFLLWQIRRIRSRSHQSNVIAIERASSPLKDIAKSLGIYALIEAVGAGLISFGLGIPFQKIWPSYVLFLLPMLFGLPLIYNSRRFPDRPKSRAIRFAFAMAVFSFLIFVAMYYSGLYDFLMSPRPTSVGELVFVALFSVAAAGGSGYFIAYGRMTSRLSERGNASKASHPP
jgi:hypothetical protein